MNLTVRSEVPSIHPLESLSMYTTLLVSIAESIKVQHDILSVLRDIPELLHGFPVDELLKVQNYVSVVNSMYTQKKASARRKELLQLLNIAVELKRLNRQIIAALSNSYESFSAMDRPQHQTGPYMH